MVARPEAPRPESLTLPPRERFTAGNGLRVTLVPAGALPKADVRLVLRAGSIDESPEQTWLSRLAGDFLHEGTERLDAAALADAVASLGGDLEVDVDEDTTTLEARVLSEHAPEMVRLLAELVRTPRFPNEELPRLRTDLLRRLDLSRARPQTLALERFRLALYGEHPYGRVLPSNATIAAFTTEAAHDFIRSHACARRAALYVGGRFDSEAVTQAAEEAFGDWEAGSEPTGLAPSPRSERAVHLVDRAGSEQSTIYLGLPVPSPEHPDWVALWVTNALLGGSFYSRITLNLREDKGYTYSPHGVLSTRARDAYWVEIADVATPVTGASLTEIFAEVERLRSEAPSHDELEGAQRYVAGNHLLHFATPGGIIEQFASLDLQGLPEEFAAIFTDRVYAVTPPEVQSIAMKHLRPDEMTIAVVGDAEQVRSQVEPFGRIVTSEAQ